MSEAAARVGRLYGLDQIVLWLFRGVAIIVLLLGIHYWLMLLGVTDPAFRFDTMPNHWKIAATTLCVLMPVASLGLWGLYRWGVAIWLIAVSVELFMHLLLPERFGENRLLVVFHLAAIALFVGYRLLRWIERRRAVS